jgi:hypothetical protein
VVINLSLAQQLHWKRSSVLFLSESCPLVAAAAYLENPRFQAMLQQEPMNPQVAKVGREVDVSWDIAVRASALLGVNPHLVEALQVVRYTSPDAEYKLHHDHGGKLFS